MVKRFLTLRSLTIFLLTLSIVACKKGCDDEPIDTCEGRQPNFVADFRIGEFVGDSLAETDTFLNIYLAMGVRVDNKKYDSVKWKIGNDPRDFAGRMSVSLTFNESMAGMKIPVTLFAKGQTDSLCPNLPNDDGRDTITKYVTVGCGSQLSNSCANGMNIKPNFLGVWRGSMSDNPTHQFNVHIVDFGTGVSTGTNAIDYRIYNIPENCGGPWVSGNFSGCGGGPILPTSFGYKPDYFGRNAFSIYDTSNDNTPCCPHSLHIYGIVDKADTRKITIYLTNRKTKEKKVFNGIKV